MAHFFLSCDLCDYTQLYFCGVSKQERMKMWRIVVDWVSDTPTYTLALEKHFTCACLNFQKKKYIYVLAIIIIISCPAVKKRDYSEVKEKKSRNMCNFLRLVVTGTNFHSCEGEGNMGFFSTFTLLSYSNNHTLFFISRMELRHLALHNTQYL